VSILGDGRVYSKMFRANCGYIEDKLSLGGHFAILAEFTKMDYTFTSICGLDGTFVGEDGVVSTIVEVMQHS
jgi:hypothetical protein